MAAFCVVNKSYKDLYMKELKDKIIIRNFSRFRESVN